MGRATVAQERRSPNARVMNSLPPMLAKTTGQRWMKSNQDMVSENSRASVPSTLRSPMFKMVAQEMRSTNADADISPSALASQRLRAPAKSSLLSRDIEQQDKTFDWSELSKHLNNIGLCTVKFKNWNKDDRSQYVKDIITSGKDIKIIY